MTLIKELIEIPEQIQRGDFVLKLVDGVEHAQETLSQYVVTDQLRTCFDDALAFVKSAVTSGQSKAAYLHGSFGSGKSHFMAVLHLLLEHRPEARAVKALAPLVAKHDDWTQGKRFLLVPYHMIGAHSMEAAILGGYVERVRRLHPEAPLPAVYLAGHLFDNARDMREQIGDEAFFKALNRAGSGDWGALDAAWDATTFEEALVAPPGDDRRLRLVSDLVGGVFTAFRQVAKSGGEAYVGLDEGLSIVSRHAQSLGYHGVILFLDELILWLASHVADLPFVNREMEKLAKLVEAQSSDRPIPLISFVARQRDLRELVGDHVPGAEKLGFLDGLKWSDGRFHVVKLEDRNLPKIAGQRILRPRSDAARIQIDAAFRETLKARSDVIETLLTSGSDQAMFREVYPFTPALIQTLVGVSSMLQRERTALRVMLQLLVNRRETLALGDVIPVGDLFDVISEGDEPFTEDMRVHFENAKRLYHQKLLPLLEKENQIRAEAVRALPSDDPQRKRFQAQDRLLKTLLLASLVPEVEALRELTAARLSALNHGSIQTPIPGQEGAYVLGLCRRWAGTVGEIKIGAGTNPTIQVQISGIDVGPILDKVRGEDNTGNRRLKIRELLFSELGIEDHDKLYVDHAFPWRGTRREVSVIFGNVRELPDTSLRAADGDVKVVLDYPFDVEGHSPDEDVERLERFKESASGPSLTLCWLPHFLSRETLADLGTLVLLEHVLVGERFNDCASHLSAVDRAAARALLDNQRSSLRQRLISVIEGAYGVREAVDGTLDRSHEMEQPFHSLDPSFAPQPPVGAGLEDAFQHLLGQLMAHRYPEHPKFETDVKISALRKVLGEAERAVQAEGGRVIVEKELRPLLRQIADPLKLGQMYESAFILGQHWKNHFLKKAAEHGGQITVERLRAWTDEPRPMGLTKEVQNLLILVFADQTDRSFYRHGGPEVPSLEQLADDVELREQRLPPEVVWQEARLRAGAVFGLSPSPLRNAANVTSLARDLVEQAKAVGTSARALAELVASRLRSMGADADVASRFLTAHAAMKLVASISAGGGEGAIDALCAARLETSPQAVGKSLRQASELVRVLEGDSFRLLDGIRGLSDHRREAAQVILRHAREALEHDELAEPLRPALDKAAQDALALLTSTAPAPAKPAPGRKLIVQRAERDLTPERASGLLEEISEQLKPPNRRLSITWQIEDVGGGGS